VSAIFFMVVSSCLMVSIWMVEKLLWSSSPWRWFWCVPPVSTAGAFFCCFCWLAWLLLGEISCWLWLFFWFWPEFCLDCVDGEPGGCEGRVEIVASCGAVDVRQFSSEVKTWDFACLHRCRIDLIKRHSANRDNRFLQWPDRIDFQANLLEEFAGVELAGQLGK